MRQIVIDGIGIAAGLCSMTSFIPQVVKLLREKDAEGISLRMYAVTVTGFTLWTAYGVFLHSIPLVFANGVSLALAGAILVLKVRYDRAAARSGPS